MSELDTVRTLAELEKENLSLKRENVALHKTVEKLLKEMNKKSEEIAHLTNLVSQTVPVVQSPKHEGKKLVVAITAEEEIAEFQLERLRQAAKIRALTLEETRMFDLLVKNKRLSKDESTINLSKGSYREVTEAELVKLAEKPDESDK